MPCTMPRSTAQITGCSMAASPNGQCSDTMRSPSPCLSAWAAKPWAVRASATACSAVRNDARRAALRRGRGRAAHGAAMAWPYSSADLLGHRLGLVVGQQRQRPAEQRHEQVVVAHRDLEATSPAR